MKTSACVSRSDAGATRSKAGPSTVSRPTPSAWMLLMIGSKDEQHAEEDDDRGTTSAGPQSI